MITNMKLTTYVRENFIGFAVLVSIVRSQDNHEISRLEYDLQQLGNELRNQMNYMEHENLQRKSDIQEMHNNMDELKRNNQDLSSENEQLKRDYQRLEEHVNGHRSQVEASINKLTGDVERLRSSNNQFDNMINRIGQEQTAMRDNLNEMLYTVNYARDDLSKVSQDLGDIRNDFTQQKQENQRIAEDMRRIQDELTELNSKNVKISDDVRLLLDDKNRLQSTVSTIETDVRKVSDDNSILERDVQRLQEDVSKYTSNIRDIEKTQEDIMGDVTYIQSRYNEVKQDIIRQENEQRRMKEISEELKARAITFENQHVEFRADLNSLNTKNTDILGQVTLMTESTSEIRSELDIVKESNLALQNTLQEIVRSNPDIKIDNLQDGTADLRNDIMEMRRSIENLNLETGSLKQEVSSLSERTNVILSNYNGTENRLSLVEERSNTLHKNIGTLLTDTVQMYMTIDAIRGQYLAVSRKADQIADQTNRFADDIIRLYESETKNNYSISQIERQLHGLHRHTNSIPTEVASNSAGNMELDSVRNYIRTVNASLNDKYKSMEYRLSQQLEGVNDSISQVSNQVSQLHELRSQSHLGPASDDITADLMNSHIQDLNGSINQKYIILDTKISQMAQYNNHNIEQIKADVVQLAGVTNQLQYNYQHNQNQNINRNDIMNVIHEINSTVQTRNSNDNHILQSLRLEQQRVNDNLNDVDMNLHSMHSSLVHTVERLKRNQTELIGAFRQLLATSDSRHRQFESNLNGLVSNQSQTSTTVHWMRNDLSFLQNSVSTLQDDVTRVKSGQTFLAADIGPMSSQIQEIPHNINTDITELKNNFSKIIDDVESLKDDMSRRVSQSDISHTNIVLETIRKNNLKLLQDVGVLRNDLNQIRQELFNRATRLDVNLIREEMGRLRAVDTSLWNNITASWEETNQVKGTVEELNTKLIITEQNYTHLNQFSTSLHSDLTKMQLDVLSLQYKVYDLILMNHHHDSQASMEHLTNLSSLTVNLTKNSESLEQVRADIIYLQQQNHQQDNELHILKQHTQLGNVSRNDVLFHNTIQLNNETIQDLIKAAENSGTSSSLLNNLLSLLQQLSQGTNNLYQNVSDINRQLNGLQNDFTNIVRTINQAQKDLDDLKLDNIQIHSNVDGLRTIKDHLKQDLQSLEDQVRQLRTI